MRIPKCCVNCPNKGGICNCTLPSLTNEYVDDGKDDCSVLDLTVYTYDNPEFKKLYLEQIGFSRPTIVRYGNKTVVSVGMKVDDLCKFWRQELELYDKNYTLVFLSAKEFRGAGQRTLHGTKTLIEIFLENGFKCELLDKDN